MPRAVSAGTKPPATAIPAGLFVVAGLLAAIAYLAVDDAAANGVLDNSSQVHIDVNIQ